MTLTETEARVLGALIEKDMATPEYYPLSLNALVNACNQKTNREPVVHYDEETVLRAIEALRDKKLALVRTGDGRVPKYAHRIGETLNLSNRELAVLAVLLLRGPQTVGELKERTQRLHSFDDLEGVDACLRRLMEWEPEPLSQRMPRRPGEREQRYWHRFFGEAPPEPETAAVSARPPLEPLGERVARLELAVAQLQEELARLRRQCE